MPTLTQGPIAVDFDERLANLVLAFEADVENPDRETILFLIANLQRARSALKVCEKLGKASAEAVKDGLEVVGE